VAQIVDKVTFGHWKGKHLPKIILRVLADAEDPEPSAEWWDPLGSSLSCYGAWAAKSAASQAASYTDLTGNSHTLGVGNAPGWSAENGWEIDNSVSAQYLTTGFTLQDDQSQTMSVQYSNVTTAGYFMGAWQSASKAFTFYPNYGGGAGVVYYFNGSSKNAGPKLLAGNMCVAGNKGYRNGVEDVTSISSGIGSWGAYDVYIGCVNNNGSPGSGASLYIESVALYDEVVSPTDIAAIYAAMAAL
jgi:hypothetical protein